MSSRDPLSRSVPPRAADPPGEAPDRYTMGNRRDQLESRAHPWYDVLRSAFPFAPKLLGRVQGETRAAAEATARAQYGADVEVTLTVTKRRRDADNPFRRRNQHPTNPNNPRRGK